MNLAKTLLIFLLMILTSCYATAQNTAEQEVRKLERAWLDAYEQRDAKAMETIVADDFTITFADGSIRTKPQIINSIKNSHNNPPPKFYTEDVQARVYGDTVILVGRVISEWQQNGNTMKEQNRYTDTYVRRNGRWQVIASHLSNAAKSPNQNSTVSSNSGAGRSLNKNKIVSLENPPLRIEVDEQMPHVGILNFKLKEVAQVERYIYARHDESKRIQRLFIAQFESILPGIKGGYNFQIINPTRLGNHDYQTDIGIFNFAERIAANPKAEAEFTKTLLDKSNLKADDDFLIARYARITSEDKRTELILFYLENLRDLGFSRAEIELGGKRAAETEKIFSDFAERAIRSFKVTDRKS